MTATLELKQSAAWNNLPWQKYAPDTRNLYEWGLEKFFDFAKLGPEAFVEKATSDKKWGEAVVVDFAKSAMDRKLAGGSVVLLIAPVKKFCKMNDVPINWDRVGAHLPRQRKYASDRAPTMEEVKLLLQDADLRLKAIILVMLSSGIRIGAWNYLRVKDAEPVEQDGKLVCAKLKVYAGEPEEYTTFLTPEAYSALKAYLEFRKMNGEEVEPDSTLIVQRFRSKRDSPVKLKPIQITGRGVRRLIEGALRSHKIRTGIKRRHEFKVAHGFRKLFKTRAQVAMKPIHVEMLMGHDVGLEASYYKPSEKELVEDYLKAIPLLTVSKEFEQAESIKKLNAEFELKAQDYEKLEALVKTYGDRLAQLEAERSSISQK